MAAIEAFKLAFGRSSNCRLVLKVNNSDKRPSAVQFLREVCAGFPVTLIDRVVSRQEVNALMQACDCLVSLHRSEGFGFPLAEGMYLGKPVIATAYSGNMDFTRPHNSFLVSYRMVPVGKGAEPYQESCLWADPLIPDAAQQMKLVYECPELRHRVARAGQDFVRQHLSPEAVGKLMRERLEHLSIRGRVDLINGRQPWPAAVDAN